jgi:hypothetical protein
MKQPRGDTRLFFLRCRNGRRLDAWKLRGWRMTRKYLAHPGIF